MRPISDAWTSSVLLADGAMGTLLFDRDAGVTTCVEMLNIDAPADVERAHREYVNAGAMLLETNTFAANRLKLGPHEQAARVTEINAMGVAIARRAAAGRAWVAASIGPLGALMRPIGIIGRDEAADVFAEHAAALAAASPDLLLLETFISLDEALLALAAARTVARNLPVLVSLSVLEDGRTPAGDALLDAFRALRDAGADACGVNCAVGPQAVYDAIAPIIGEFDFPISLMPNAGYPHRVDDRTVYGSAPPYFARFARAYVEIGASIVGGCCGTTPSHIAAMAPEVAGKPRAARRKAPARTTPAIAEIPARTPGTAKARVTEFERKLGKEFVVTAEIAPPRGTDYGASVAAARMLAAAGFDAVHVSDNPTARLRMSGAVAAHVIMREAGIAAVLHFSCRDRNLLGLQSELLGASALGIPAIVALTGDPSNVGDFPKATSVFDVTALGLTRILHDLNGGKDHAGNEIGGATNFRIGAAVNPTARDLVAERERFDEKVAAGADLVLTQPVFDPAALAPFLGFAKAAKVPVLVGLLPLRSLANAEYLHNEVPGMQVPDAIRDRLRAAADQASEGKAIARELLLELAGTNGVAGVYVIAQEDYAAAAEIVSALKRAPSRA